MPTPSDSDFRPRPWSPALAAAAFVAVALSVAGCGGEPGLAGARGRVTYNGKPVTSGEVHFSPEEPGKRGAHGDIDSDGYYKLGTFTPGDGAYVGKHKVSVVAVGPDKPVPPKMKGKMMPEDMQGSGNPLVPRRYFSPDTSGLSADVEAGGSNDFPFELKD